MTIEKIFNGSELTLILSGRLDTDTAPGLDTELKQNLPGTKTLIFDLAGIEYLSSAGLRVLLTAQKAMNRQGEMIVKNANESVLEIFEITGFLDILTVK